jgi:hypothetical protein
MNEKAHDWIRCTKTNRCPVCDRDHYCEISADGKVVLCTKVESDRPTKSGVGWIHRLSDPVKPPPPPKHKKAPIPQPQMARLAVEYFNRCKHPELLGNALGLSVASMRECGLGYDGRNWTCPEFNAQRRIIGIELRPPAGHKFTVTGSYRGLTWPTGIGKKLEEPLLICEGWSDTVVARDMGFEVLGRPNCSALPNMIVEAIQTRMTHRTIWIFSDLDPIDPKNGKRAGLAGAYTLANMLLSIRRIVKILHAPQTKDLRSWYNAGATRQMVESLAANTGYWSI